ncbi:hypothetical protein CWB58_03075 [Pseudoalteromonas sp. S201]|uniref:hypothetical protein n=1 Tax=Pseudoalteromonas TaxID=53246 RepID=UPI0006BAC9C1|nr:MULTISPECIES: hypothetical protein [Pseudoalteromonas]KPH91557.1 hypothetical protein AMS57_05590 [Pseudoalteromonas undina]MCK8125278.1 hypothetical protein [Pseudoalteromonas sp. 2CM39R]NWL17632.1 hypothetical protein [Pseudoalteromonas sp. Scap03]QLE83053.1 hypothetical protein FLM54_16070 [Pseudoalteromonas sp. Scap25]QLE90995.1 hypothetical protein FLM47_16080 [Pseudoalteromonas sp. Scap06]
MFKNEEVFLLFPPWKLLRRFLLVTVILLIGTVYSGMTLLTQYFDTSPEWLLGILFSVGIMFCLLNFKVSQGSFLCAKLLKYYALFLALICLPSFIILEGNGYHIATVTNIAFMLLSFYLIKGNKYQGLIKYQYNFFKDIKDARAAVEKEIAKGNKRKKK